MCKLFIGMTVNREADYVSSEAEIIVNLQTVLQVICEEMGNLENRKGQWFSSLDDG